MKRQRQLQVGEKIKRLLGEIFTYDHNFITKDNQNITINQADISPDLRKVKIIIDSTSKIEKKEILRQLYQLVPYVKKQLSKQTNLRFIPEIDFAFYNEKKDIYRIEEILLSESKRFNNEK